MDSKGVRYIINIVNTRKGGRRVRPPKVTVEGGECLEFWNRSGEPVKLTFNQGDVIFEEFKDSRSSMIEIPGPEPVNLHVKVNPTHGEYPYQAFGTSSQEYYNGESDPRIDVL